MCKSLSLSIRAIQLTRRRKLRGYAVHLACALALNDPLMESGLPPLTFVSADDDLLAAAVAEGLIRTTLTTIHEANPWSRMATGAGHGVV